MTNSLILPLSPQTNHKDYIEADQEYARQVSIWINKRIELTYGFWSQFPKNRKKNISFNTSTLANEISNILTHRDFNFQSKTNLSPLLPSIKQNLENQLRKGSKLHFFLLYNGGYRASPFPEKLSLIFEPDQTELMLLYQITLLSKKISAVCSQDIEFSIVLNNGVAHWVNGISINDTENYAKQLRNMISSLGATNSVKVLLQSELVGFDYQFSFEPFKAKITLSHKEHSIVERFLGNSCNYEEAKHLATLYTLAEKKWWEVISTIAAKKNALILRQIAHPDMLSFRPFPGGAIRAQNGSFGFQYINNKLTPKLITSESFKQYNVKWLYYDFNNSINNIKLNNVILSNV